VCWRTYIMQPLDNVLDFLKRSMMPTRLVSVFVTARAVCSGAATVSCRHQYLRAGDLAFHNRLVTSSTASKVGNAYKNCNCILDVDNGTLYRGNAIPPSPVIVSLGRTFYNRLMTSASTSSVLAWPPISGLRSLPSIRFPSTA
jgi:hypothetical protein